MKNSNRMRVVVFTLIVAGLTGIATTWQALNVHRETTTRLSENLFEGALSAVIQELEYYSESVENDLLVITSNGIMGETLQEFDAAFDNLGSDPQGRLQALYIENNPHPVGQKDLLMRANDDSRYSALHGEYHPWFKNIVSARDYYDLFLINPQGDVVYTVFKESDLGSNLHTGILKDTVLRDVFNELLDTAAENVIATDFVRYEPSNGLPAAFAGIPIFRNNVFVGALIVQLRLDPFIRIVRASQDLGETGEIYLVGPDLLMRTESRFIEDSILSTKVDSESVSRALDGASGLWRILDYRDVPVLSAYAPFKWIGGQWAAIAEQDISEIEEIVLAGFYRIGITAVIAIALSAIAAFFLSDRSSKSQ